MHDREKLGAEHNAVTQSGPGDEEITDDLLGVAVGLGVRGVDEIAAAPEVLGEDRLGGRRVDGQLADAAWG